MTEERLHWIPRHDRDARIEAGIRLACWAAAQEDLYPAHRREFLSIAVWKVTEADGKWNTRYRSVASLSGGPGAKVTHEHVVPRKLLVAAMIARPHRVEEILTTGAVACVVQRDQHSLLNSGRFGWYRYLDAGIEVIDMATGEPLDLPGAASELSRVTSSWVGHI